MIKKTNPVFAVFKDSVIDGRTGRWTARRTDRPCYRDAMRHLKSVIISSELCSLPIFTLSRELIFLWIGVDTFWTLVHRLLFWFRLEHNLLVEGTWIGWCVKEWFGSCLNWVCVCKISSLSLSLSRLSSHQVSRIKLDSRVSRLWLWLRFLADCSYDPSC